MYYRLSSYIHTNSAGHANSCKGGTGSGPIGCPEERMRGRTLSPTAWAKSIAGACPRMTLKDGPSFLCMWKIRRFSPWERLPSWVVLSDPDLLLSDWFSAKISSRTKSGLMLSALLTKIGRALVTHLSSKWFRFGFVADLSFHSSIEHRG